MTRVDHQASLIAARQHGTFATSQLSELTESEVRTRIVGGRWTRLHRGVMAISGSPHSYEQRLWAALLRAGTGSVIGLQSAAWVQNFPGARSGFIDIVQPESSVPQVKPRSSRRTSLLLPRHLDVVRGFPVTTIERTLFDLAGLTSPQRRRRGWTYLSAARVERMLDDALAHNRISVRSMSMVFADLAGHGRPGTCVMREFLEARSDGYVASESELEDLFLELIAAHGLPEPRRQVDLGSAEASIGRVDFVFDSAKVVVEADGRRYHNQKAVQLQDKKRDLALMAEGWRVVRVEWWQLVNDGPTLTRHLAEILKRPIMH